MGAIRPTRSRLPEPHPPGYPGYPGYGGGFGPPGNTPGYPFPYYGLPAPRVVRHTLQRRTWLWVVGGHRGAGGAGRRTGGGGGRGQQPADQVEQFFPNRSVLAKPQDVQEVLAKVEPAVVSIDSEFGGRPVGGDFVQAAGSGMILTPTARC